MKIRFEVQMKSEYMYNFLINHIYKSFMGAFSILIGIAALLMAAYSWNSVRSAYVLCYIAVAVLALVYPPIMLRIKAKQQVALSPVFKHPIQYELDNEGVRVLQGDQDAFGKWEQFYKVASTAKSLIVYTDKKQAMIWPRECMGNQYGAIEELLRKEMPASKLKIK